MRGARATRRRLVPEVVQTSAMDCGPAALAALLAGLGRPASYDRLREACQTSVDGTSIDTLEEVARTLGLDARQIIVPPDFIESPEAELLPALAVARHADGQPHFVVAWSRHGGRVQLMDPATGRRWPRATELVDELWRHSAEMPVEAWRRWAAAESFQRVLAARLARLGAGPDGARRMLERGLADPSWRTLGALDAAERMVRALCDERALRRGRAAAALVEALVERVLADPPRALAAIPFRWWSARPIVEPDGSEPRLVLRGAVLVRVRGAAAPVARESLPRELALVLLPPKRGPGRALVAKLLEDGARGPLLLAGGLALAAVGALVQALLLRALLDLGTTLALPAQRVAGLAVAGVFLAAQLALELPLGALALRAGRRLETRLRLLFQGAIPRLAERYFSSRPVSDMAERAHALGLLRALPGVGARAWRFLAQMTLAAAGLFWLDPRSAPAALALVALSVGGPLLPQRLLAERELRVRTFRGALARILLDAMLGLVPLRAHRAERALEREHERLLERWRAASLRWRAAAVTIDAVLGAATLGLAVAIVLGYVARGGAPAGLLLVGWWALWLPELGRELAGALTELPAQKNAAARVFEPLGAERELDAPIHGAGEASAERGEKGPAPSAASRAFPEVRTALRAAGGAGASAASARALEPGAITPPVLGALRIELEGVDVRALGLEILRGITLTIRSGEHVALVGVSGAGKSSLIALLLGLHRPARGVLRIDGQALDASALESLRRRTAWIDPAVRLWNASLIDNVRYGGAAGWERLADSVRAARLEEVVERLPEGLRTALGEGGGLVSGGEGQRVRFARALAREGVDLALLDEPFRGLDRATRSGLLAKARERWRGATLVCATHDLEETAGFDRVLVLEGGRLVEAGAPAALARDPGSRYALALKAECAARAALGQGPGWRRLTLEGGTLIENPEGAR